VTALVLVPGTVGVGPREERWAEELNSLGVATFVLDSFRGRGIAPPFESGAVPSSLAMIVDSYRALSLLATHPRIDPERIALMGFSRGGGWRYMQAFGASSAYTGRPAWSLSHMFNFMQGA